MSARRRSCQSDHQAAFVALGPVRPFNAWRGNDRSGPKAAGFKLRHYPFDYSRKPLPLHRP